MLLVDAQPRVVRATATAVVMCARPIPAATLGFQFAGRGVLVVLAVNPADLFPAGPQLSFLGVACLSGTGPRWLRSAARQDPVQRLIWAEPRRAAAHAAANPPLFLA